MQQTADNGKWFGTKGADTLWLAGSLIYWIGVLVAAVFVVLIITLAKVDPSSAGIPGFSILVLFAAFFCGLGWAIRYGLRSAALMWYRRAAEHGVARAQNKLGLIYEKRQRKWSKLADAFTWRRKAAEQVDARAQSNLGTMDKQGLSVPQDHAEAVKSYRLAAEQGDAYAQSNLGFAYAEGLGVPLDNDEAAKWFRLAATQGDNVAQYNLGLMYENGNGVPQDYVHAHMWFNLAAARGTNEAVEKRDKVAELMTPAQIAEAEQFARDWSEQHRK